MFLNLKYYDIHQTCEINFMSTHLQERINLKSGQEIIIRNLVPSDIENYKLFSEKIASETMHTLYYSGHIFCADAIKKKWENAINSAWQLELGGFEGDKLISHLSLCKPRPHHPYEQHILEFGIAILEEYCHRGLGSIKLDIMEAIARNWQIKRIQAKVRTSNYQGIVFYQKQGYEIEGVKQQAAFIKGKYESEFYIAKFIK